MSQDSDWSEYTLDSSSSVSSEPSAHKTGGHDYQFLQEPSEDLKCTICLSVLQDPHLTSCCGHHFCEECIKPIKMKLKRCPLCQEKNFTSMLNKSLNRTINELKVYCPKTSDGCDWNGELKHAETHLKRDCEHVAVKCTYCSCSVLRKRHPDHLTKCPRRPFTCEGCGQVDAWQTITGAHRNKCPSWRIPCPNTCGSEIMRKNVKKHLKTCPLQCVPCEFEFAGCVNMSYRRDVTTHANECVSHHLSLVAETFKTELAKRDEEIDSLKALVRQQSEEICELKAQRSPSHPPTTLYMNWFEYHVSKDRWFSNPFLSHPNGYKLCLCVYPSGTGKGAGTHLSVFAHLMQGDNDDALSWPFQAKIHISLIAGTGKAFNRKLFLNPRAVPGPGATQRVTNGTMNKLGQGLPEFARLSELTDCVELQFCISSVDLKE